MLKAPCATVGEKVVGGGGGGGGGGSGGGGGDDDGDDGVRGRWGRGYVAPMVA